MDKCNAELCINWTGSGCICEVMGLDKEEARRSEVESVEETADVWECSKCDDPAEFSVQPEDVDTTHACARHLADVAREAIIAWGEHGVICLFDATEE